MDDLGPQLRALRAASGRTLASVAIEAGLSVPYVANLENGRGNPTVKALQGLADALGVTLTVTFDTEQPQRAPLPASVVRFGRTARFRRDLEAIAAATDQDQTELAGHLLQALAGLAEATGRELSEPDWHRLLDALLLVALHPG